MWEIDIIQIPAVLGKTGNAKGRSLTGEGGK
jgi:hypothetical protein